MSADNYWYVRKHPRGGWTYTMEFDSCDRPKPVFQAGRDRGYGLFETRPDAFRAAAEDDWTEYGIRTERCTCTDSETCDYCIDRGVFD